LARPRPTSKQELQTPFGEFLNKIHTDEVANWAKKAMRKSKNNNRQNLELTRKTNWSLQVLISPKLNSLMLLAAIFFITPFVQANELCAYLDDKGVMKIVNSQADVPS